MSDSQIGSRRNIVTQRPSVHSCLTQQQRDNKDIVVSIVLTDSTTSLLQLDLPHLEDLDSENSQPSVCAIKAETNIEEASSSGGSNVTEKIVEFTKYWFGCDEGKRGDRELISSEVAYFRANPEMNESIMSLDMIEELENSKLDARGESTPSLNQKLKPTKVYTRPLFTVHSVAHQNLMQSDSNNIYINVVNSQQLSPSDSGWINVCRICHGGESIGDLLAPCHCRGSIAMTHLECLERWLKESANSKCELCQHRFQIIRQPKYGVLRSIFVFLQDPGEHMSELLFDLFAFMIYTPAAVVSTYMLMILCETATHSYSKYSQNLSAHFVAFTSVIGMAAIDFTYSSWLMVNLQKHIAAWRNWYRNTCDVKVILPDNKVKRHRRNMSRNQQEVD